MPKSLDDELKELKTELEQHASSPDSKQAAKTVGTRLTTLERITHDLKAVSSAVAHQRNVADADRKRGEQLHAGLTEWLNREFPAARRSAIEKAIKAIDEDIANAASKVEGLRAQVNQSFAGTAQARQNAAAAERALNDSLRRLRGLTGEYLRARAQVNRLAEEAEHANRALPENALLVPIGLRNALDEMSALMAGKSEETLAGEVTERWHSWTTALATVDKKTAELENIRAELAAVHRQHRTKVATRDSAVRSALASPETASPKQSASRGTLARRTRKR